MLKQHCDRCGGDLYLEEDIFFTEVVCLQCGHRRMVRSERPQPVLRKSSIEVVDEPRRRRFAFG